MDDKWRKDVNVDLRKKSEKKGKWKYVFSDSFYNLEKSNDS